MSILSLHDECLRSQKIMQILMESTSRRRLCEERSRNFLQGPVSATVRLQVYSEKKMFKKLFAEKKTGKEWRGTRDTKNQV